MSNSMPATKATDPKLPKLQYKYRVEGQVPKFKFIDLGEMSPERINEIFNLATKAWAEEVAPLMRDQNKPRNFKDQLKSDFTNAAYRVGSDQLLNATRNFLVQTARRHCSEEGKILAISELLNTEIGTAIMSMFIGISVSQIPQLANSPKMNRILKEFRVSGMSSLGNSAMQSLMHSVLPVVVSALQGIEDSKVAAEELGNSTLLEDDELALDLAAEPQALRRQS